MEKERKTSIETRKKIKEIILKQRSDFKFKQNIARILKEDGAFDLQDNKCMYNNHGLFLLNF